MPSHVYLQLNILFESLTANIAFYCYKILLPFNRLSLLTIIAVQHMLFNVLFISNLMGFLQMFRDVISVQEENLLANGALVKHQLDDLLPWISKQTLVLLDCCLMYVVNMLSQAWQVYHLVTKATEYLTGVYRVVAKCSVFLLSILEVSGSYITCHLHWLLAVNQAWATHFQLFLSWGYARWTDGPH